ncbi:hypothetical protein DYB37_010794 [Aphanomyces astaci]|uniref:Retroviral polymerase SH3-like domain-containing protein n=1 Tax=Aphanomyces astaci TaxID=112090 RepID=A0A3R6XAY1_APHAT|nr:hypothetical protein DYB35_013173 [Aphanomyces astaci]RHZ11377.1 hypothetical protein DYB37_010794 [Aphanomyces astaci]
MKVFGCVAYNMIKDPSRRDKLASKAAKCVFLGYSENVKALKLYDLAANKTVTGVHVRFHETEFLGERAKIDDYVVTRDDDDDEEIDTSDESAHTKPSTTPAATPRHQVKTPRMTLRLGTPRQQASSAAVAPTSHFRIPSLQRTIAAIKLTTKTSPADKQ